MEAIELARYIKDCLDRWISITDCDIEGAHLKAPSVMVTDSDGTNFEVVVEEY